MMNQLYGYESEQQKQFEKFMMQYKPEFRDFNKIGEYTYSNTLTSIAYDCYLEGTRNKEQEFDDLYEALQEIQTMAHKSISFEHDLYDKGWNHSSRQTVINIHRLTGIGEDLLK